MIHNSVLLATFLSKKKTKRIYALEVILVPKRGKKLTRHVDVLLAREPDARVKLPHQVLVLARFPDVVHSVGQLPLPDLGQLIPPCRGHGAVEGVLGGALWKTPHKKTGERLM